MSAELQRTGNDVEKRPGCSVLSYQTFRRANNKNADKTAQMRSRVCVFDVCIGLHEDKVTLWRG